MKNLNSTIEKAIMPKSVKSLSSKLLCSLCAALFLVASSLSSKAQTGTGPDDLYVLPFTLGFSGSNVTYGIDYPCTSCSPFINNHGDPNDGVSDKWIEINIADAGYLSIIGGTSSFDSVFYLYDSNWNLVAYEDDGYNSGSNIHNHLQPGITYYSVGANSKYYLVVEGSTKYISEPGTDWTSPNGYLEVFFYLD